MKRGKRQIVERNVFQNQQNSDNNQSNLSESILQSNFIPQAASRPSHQIYQSTYNQFQPNTQDQQPKTHTDKQSGPLNRGQEKKNPLNQSYQKSSISTFSEVRKVQIPAKSVITEKGISDQPQHVQKDSNDEKKNRIQMLKQKYLKKGNEAKPTAQSQVTKQATNVQQKIISKTKQETNIIHSVASSQVQTKIQPKMLSSRHVATKIDLKQKQDNQQHSKKQINSGLPISHQPVPAKNQAFQKAQPLKEQKKPFKIPPPPPSNLKKTKPVPVVQKQQQSEKTVNTFYEPFSSPAILNKQQNEINNTKEIKTVAPPPPPVTKKYQKTNTVQQILAKRLNKQENVEVIQTKNKNIQQYHTLQQEQTYTAANKQSQNMPFDEQYIEKSEKAKPYHRQHAEKQIQIQSKIQKQVSIKQIILLWCNGSDKLFSKLLPESNLHIFLQKTSNALQLDLKSKNSAFNEIAKGIIMEFVIKNENELTEGQKYVVHELALQYFYSGLISLSNEFLLLLVKLGINYLVKYNQFLKNSIQSSCLVILQYKQYFSEVQITNFVNYILDNQPLKQESFYLLILLYPSQKLLIHLSANQINDQRAIVLALAACQFVSKTNKNIFGLYLRLISTLSSTISHDVSLLQTILKYVSQLQPHEKYYQAQKQIKLKLINLISNAGKDPQPIAKPQRQQQKQVKQQKGQNSGLMGIWNKAVHKIKNATIQLKEKEKEKIQQPQEDIVYDPVSKRYLVNGKAFEDQQSREQEQNALKAPPAPPPPKGNRPVAPPPPPGNKKPRTITAANRYA